MGASCNIFARKRNRQTGKLTNKISQLHKDLLAINEFNKDFIRSKANHALFLSQYPKFLEQNEDNLIFDSADLDAEPKLASFYEVAQEHMPEVKYEDIRQLLAKKFKEGNYTYEQAYEKIVKFNSEMEGAHSFIATMKPSSDGQWECTIVRNTIQNQEELITNLKNKIFYEEIIKKLNSLGVKVSDGLISEYNTKNPKSFQDGLIGLITIAQGKQYSEHLAKEAGHFIIGALGENHPLYKRLLSLVENNEEVVSAILGSDEWTRQNYNTDSNATREFLGHIVGKYLYQVFEEQQTKKTAFQSIKNIIDRMIKWCKARFNIRHMIVSNQIYNAEQTARKIARNFLGDNFDGSLQEAMKQKEILHAETNSAFTAIRDNIQVIVLSIERCKSLGSKTVLQNKKAALGQFLKSFGEIKNTTTKLQNQEEVSIFNQTQLIEEKASALIEILEHCVEQYADCMAVLQTAITGERDGEILTPQERAKAIRYNETTLKMIEQIRDNTKSVLEEFDSQSDYGIALRDSYKRLTEVLRKDFVNPLSQIENPDAVESWETLIEQGRKVLACELLTEVNGSPFVYLEAFGTTENMSTSDSRIWRFFGKRAFIKHEEDTISINNILNNADMFPKAGWVSKYIASISEHPDRLQSLVYDTVARQKHTSMKKTLVMQQELHRLYTDLKKIGHSNTDFLFEKDENGRLTGNLISKVDWGRWERDLKETQKLFREDFYKKYKEIYPNKAEAFKSLEYMQAYADMIKKFHFEHSELKTMKDENGNPVLDENDEKVKYNSPKADDYHSSQYDKLSDAEKEWLEKYMKLKRQLDRQLPFGCTNPEGVRAPQFPGTLTNNISNAMKVKGVANKGGALVYNTLSSSLFYFFSKENPDNILFGGDNNTSNDDIEDKEEDGGQKIVKKPYAVYNKNIKEDLAEVENLPVYGVRRSPNSLARLSTDLMYSTLAYAAMSNNYDCLNQVVDQLELVKGITITTRKEKNHTESAKIKRDNIESYETMRDFMTFNVYGNYHPTNDDTNLYKLTKKTSNILARFGSFLYLGFNAASAVFNTNTGIVEILKESCRNTLMVGSGSDGRMTLKSALHAHLIFLKHASYALLDNIMKAGGLKKSIGSNIQSGDKMMSFLRAMDSSNENERKFREDRVQTKGWTTFQGFGISNLALLPYSTTDRYLQGISYIASALNTPVLDTETGKITNLYDAYKMVDGVCTIDQQRYKVYDKQNAKILRFLQAKAETASEKGDMTLGLTSEEKEYLKNANKEMATIEGIDIDDLNNLSEEQKKELENQIHWVNINDEWESRFRTKCRKENNRMHGVYNKQDTGNGLNKVAVAGMVMSMKKYLLGIWSRLYASSRYDSSTGDMYQGVINTLLDLFVLEVGHNYAVDSNGKLDKTVDKYYDKNACQAAVIFIKGIFKFTAIACTGGLLSRKQLQKQGFTQTQLSNIATILFTQIAIKLIRMGCYWLLPPDDEDSVEEWKWSLPISEAFLDADLYIKNKLYWHKSTIANEVMFTDIYQESRIRHFSHSIPYSVKGLCFWTLYRLAREQEFANPLDPKPFLIELKTQTANSITGIQAFVDVLTKGSLIMQDVDINKIQDWDEKEKYFGGKEIYTQGTNKYWTKGGKGLEQLSPFKNLRALSDPYHASANTMYYDAQTLSLGPDDSQIPGVNNRDKNFWQSIDYAFRGNSALKNNPPKITSEEETDYTNLNKILKGKLERNVFYGSYYKSQNPEYDPFYDPTYFSLDQQEAYTNTKKEENKKIQKEQREREVNYLLSK